jgi:hypothetical protein
VGQRGQGGGVIVSVIVEGSTTQYVEMALSGWAGTATDPKVNWATANAQARAFRGGGLSDWRLPTLTPELEAMCRYGQGKNFIFVLRSVLHKSKSSLWWFRPWQRIHGLLGFCGWWRR